MVFSCVGFPIVNDYKYGGALFEDRLVQLPVQSTCSFLLYLFMHARTAVRPCATGMHNLDPIGINPLLLCLSTLQVDCAKPDLIKINLNPLRKVVSDRSKSHSISGKINNKHALKHSVATYL